MSASIFSVRYRLTACKARPRAARVTYLCILEDVNTWPTSHGPYYIPNCPNIRCFLLVRYSHHYTISYCVQQLKFLYKSALYVNYSETSKTKIIRFWVVILEKFCRFRTLVIFNFLLGTYNT